MPPLTIENAGALVPGGVTASQISEEKTMIQKPVAALPKEQKVKVTRAFYYKGVVHAVGTEHTIPYIFAKEMEAAKKCVFVEPEAPKPVEPAAAAKVEPKPATASATAPEPKKEPARETKGGDKK